MPVLGLDTSNYTTSAAFFDGNGGRNTSRLLDVRPGELGLRQSDALFQHVKRLPELLEGLAGERLLSEIEAVGASTRPRAVEGSYMPCFLAGESQGRGIAAALGVPFYAWSHQQGHLAAAAWSAGRLDLLDAPFLAWHLSGGTTELLLVRPEGVAVTTEIIGGTSDLSAGQLIDRTGVLLGLQFPAGKALDRLYAQADICYEPRVKLKDFMFSLSGMENQVKALKEKGEKPETIARFALDAVSSVVIRATQEAQRRYSSLPVLCSGGVASNSQLRAGMQELCGALFAQPQYSTDNAMGTAILTWRALKAGGEAMREDAILTPSQVGQYLKNMMDRDHLLSRLLVRGELSNYKMYPSGHHYFTLKDGEGALRCVMFRSDAVSLRFRPENGMQVIAAGRVTVFPRDGQYQMYCARLTPEGVGDLALAFEQLKEKLAREGLFDLAYKKEIPAFPKRIALITSPAGAAVRDMIRILDARWPLSEIRVIPVRVQGAEAPQEIAAAIQWANLHHAADLIITGRGGGSMEDLWAFNEEIVARAIYRSEIPVISAVGHEPDVTIADFVADLRASTPSNAAELAVPDQNEVYMSLLGDRERLEGSVAVKLARYRQTLARLADSRTMTDPASYFREKRLLLDYQSSRLAHGLRQSAAGQRERLGKLSSRLPGGAERTVAKRRERLNSLAAALDAMSPLKVLGRGYSIAQREDGKAVVSTGDVSTGDRLKLTLSDGSVDCQVL